MTDNINNIWAFLVGINEYRSPGIRTLHGCVNDVKAMQRFLKNQMNVPDNQIKVLINQEATRDEIIRWFKKFLIENSDIPKNSQLFFHFSGHGSQMRNTSDTEPDGLDETIVPYDSRINNIFDIPDKTLAGLIDLLAAEKGDNITVILDSCHSGSGTREIRPEGAAPTRRAPSDPRMPPADLDSELRSKESKRGETRSGWAVTRPNHVLMAGCLDREESNEYPNPEGILYGALTYFSLEYLRQKQPGALYADWYGYAMRRVNSFYPSQTPQCEGQRDRTIFGDTYVELDPFIPVKKIAGENKIIVEAGLLLGMNADTELAIYPFTVTNKQNLPKPLGIARVVSVTATTATASFTETPPQNLPKVIHALITQQGYSGIRQKVAIMPAQNGADRKALQVLKNAIRNAAGRSIPSPYLNLLEDPNQPAGLRVTSDNGKLTITDDKGNILVNTQDYKNSGAGPVLRALESIARFRTMLELSNREQSDLSGKIKVSLTQCTNGKFLGDDLVQETSKSGDKLTLRYDPRDSMSNQYLVSIYNRSKLEIYPYLFYLGPDYSIEPIYPPAGVNEALKPNATLSVRNFGFDGGSISVYLPGDKPGEIYWDSSNDSLKLIVSTQPNEQIPIILKQGPLEVPPPQTRAAGANVSPLGQLLDSVTSGTRHACLASAVNKEDWTSVTIPFTVTRVTSIKTLDKAKPSVDIGDQIILEKPKGFEGKITVAPIEESRRSIGEDAALKLPPGMAKLEDSFQPISRTGTRGLSGQPLVITLETDEASRNLITPEKPLRLRIPDNSAAYDFLPIAFDGEDYLPVGYGTNGDTVDIIKIPLASGSSQPGKRGIGKAIKLFVYKKTGRHSRDLGLRSGEIVNGLVSYSDVKKNTFRKGDRIAIMIHGFLSDSGWMVRDIVPFLSTLEPAYNHFLTWDFETFGTAVETNGLDMATVLRQQCGFRKGDNLTVHIYGHGLGCLVARCMNELSGGHEFLDRMILAGPPNRGTSLATISRGFIYLLSCMINNISSIPLASAFTWPLKELYEQVGGWNDITTDSDICMKLNSLDTTVNVPYLVLAGMNDEHQTQGARFNRLAHKIMDQTLGAIFGETEHDTIVGMKSMTGVRNGTYPNLKVVKIDCNHFSYFENIKSQVTIRKQI